MAGVPYHYILRNLWVRKLTWMVGLAGMPLEPQSRDRVGATFHRKSWESCRPRQNSLSNLNKW